MYLNTLEFKYVLSKHRYQTCLEEIKCLEMWDKKVFTGSISLIWFQIWQYLSIFIMFFIKSYLFLLKCFPHTPCFSPSTLYIMCRSCVRHMYIINAQTPCTLWVFFLKVVMTFIAKDTRCTCGSYDNRWWYHKIVCFLTFVGTYLDGIKMINDTWYNDESLDKK